MPNDKQSKGADAGSSVGVARGPVRTGYRTIPFDVPGPTLRFRGVPIYCWDATLAQAASLRFHCRWRDQIVDMTRYVHYLPPYEKVPR